MMNVSLIQKFEKIRDFLRPYEDIYCREVMNSFPTSLSFYKDEWLDAIEVLSDEDLYKIDTHESYDQIKCDELKTLFSKLDELKVVDDVKDVFGPIELYENNYTTYLGVRDKKRHELKIFFGLMKKIQETYPIKEVLNVGGGVGHISRIFAFDFKIKATDIDMNKEFQDLGVKKLRLYQRDDDALDINFVTLKLGSDNDPSVLKSLFRPGVFVTGLHTCGPLAVRIIEDVIKYQADAVLNFGCCYGLIRDDHDVNISNCAQNNPIKISRYARTLATRLHIERNFESFKLKRRVKAYRYGLHLFNYYNLGQIDFAPVGNGSAELYNSDFATYYQAMTGSKSDREKLNRFFEDHKTLINRMFAADIIRYQFGRCVELLILLDRAIALSEHGYDAKVFTVFDELESPRNIAILANKI